LRVSLGRCDLSLLWQLELWIRTGEEDRLITDYAAVDQLLVWLRQQAPDLTVRIWTAPRLHAKIFWTERGALIGSANMTGAGCGGNVELGVRLEAEECLAASSIREVLRQGLTEVGIDQWKALVRLPAPPTSGVFPPRDTPAQAEWADMLEKLLSRRPDF